MEWIDIKIQIPNEEQLVNVLLKNGRICLIEYFHNYRRLYAPFCGNFDCSIDSEDIIYWMSLPNQPERSKREDSQKCEMRCSEHCGNTVRDK